MPAEVVVDGDNGEGSRTKLFGVSIPATKASRNVLLGDYMDLDMNPRWDRKEATSKNDLQLTHLVELLFYRFPAIIRETQVQA